MHKRLKGCYKVLQKNDSSTLKIIGYNSRVRPCCYTKPPVQQDPTLLVEAHHPENLPPQAQHQNQASKQLS